MTSGLFNSYVSWKVTKLFLLSRLVFLEVMVGCLLRIDVTFLREIEYNSCSEPIRKCKSSLIGSLVNILDKCLSTILYYLSIHQGLLPEYVVGNPEGSSLLDIYLIYYLVD